MILGIAGNLGELEIEMDEPAAAEAHLRQAIAAGESIHGEAHPSVALARIRLARALRASGRDRDATREAERALADTESADQDVAALARFELAKLSAPADPQKARRLAEAALSHWQHADAPLSEAAPFVDSREQNAALARAWLDERP